jgi:hypothetical protein
MMLCTLLCIFILCDMQIEAYRHMISPVVDAFKYLTQVCIFLYFPFTILFTASTGHIIIRELIISSKRC